MNFAPDEFGVIKTYRRRRRRNRIGDHRQVAFYIAILNLTRKWFKLKHEFFIWCC